MSAQGLSQRRMSPDLSVTPEDYFGAPVDDLRNADAFGLVPTDEKDLYRVQYLYLLVFGNERSSTDYGGIQVRASTYLYLKNGNLPARKFQRVMQRCAHRGAFLFDSSLEEPIYGSGGGDWSDGGGYLSGFTPVENGADYRNWEVEPVGSAEGRPAGVQPGVIRWTTEVYLEVEGTKYADLSGVGQGVADPYSVVEHEVPPDEPIQAQQEWWEFSDNFNSARGSYQIAPPAYSQARRRGQQTLHGKDVYLNGLYIGEIDTEGRVWLKKEYANGQTYQGQHSREAILEKTTATPQALALGRKIAKVDESPSAVHLATKQFRPDDFDPVDPDDVDPEFEVQPGSPGGTVYLLSLPDSANDPTRQECRQDQEIISHLGYSDPVYSHTYAQMWKWPGDRSISNHGAVTWWREVRDSDQTGLDGFGGDGA